jgi:catechol 2,3-dioxygenase-like lactoylglutathione lyase family enzyme
MSAIAAPASVKFHLSLNVASLDRSVAFFQALFGCEAAKCRPDYAKFELDEPPVVLSLEPHAPGSSGALNHLGFRLADSAELIEWQRRLEAAGIQTQREEGVECCYARQTKFWVRDPDNNLWEIYVLDEDIEHRGMGQVPDDLPPPVGQTSTSAAGATAGSSSSANEPPAPAIWQHTLGTPLPTKIFALDASTAEVQLRGSFNATHGSAIRGQFLAEVFRILASGGTVSLHMLTATSELTFPAGTLPDPASYVTQALPLDQLLDDLKAAGFESPQLTKYGARPCFAHDGVKLRETMLTVRKPAG